MILQILKAITMKKTKDVILQFAKKDILNVPVPLLAECIDRNKLSISDVKKTWSQYPLEKLLIPILDGAVSDLDLKIFDGELEFGQNINWFEEYYHTKRGSISKSKSGTKIELIAFGESNAIDREVQSLILKFEDGKLSSYEDKRDISKIYTRKLHPESFSDLWLLRPSEVLTLIINENAGEEFKSNELEKLIIHAWNNDRENWDSLKLGNVVDILLSQKILGEMNTAKCFDLIIKNYPKQNFLKKIEEIFKLGNEDLDYSGLIKMYIDGIKDLIRELNKSLKSKVKDSGYYAKDGSSTLIPYVGNKHKNLSQKLTKYEVEGQSKWQKINVISVNEYIDLFKSEIINTYLKNFDGLKNIEQVNVNDIDQSKKVIEEELLKFEEIKRKSTEKAKEFIKTDKSDTILGCAVLIVVLVLVVWFVIWLLD